MRIERTHDMNAVQAIMHHEKIWDKIHDDGSIEAIPIDSEILYWLGVYDGDEMCGFYLLHPVNTACFEMHTCLLPKIWGRKANEAAILFRDYVFGVIGIKKLVTNVPESNKIALKYAIKNGMVIEGINRKSFLKNGILEDQTMLGMTLEEWKSCQQQFQH